MQFIFIIWLLRRRKTTLLWLLSFTAIMILFLSLMKSSYSFILTLTFIIITTVLFFWFKGFKFFWLKFSCIFDTGLLLWLLLLYLIMIFISIKLIIVRLSSTTAGIILSWILCFEQLSFIIVYIILILSNIIFTNLTTYTTWLCIFIFLI